jgi:hypothetical protein
MGSLLRERVMGEVESRLHMTRAQAPAGLEGARPRLHRSPNTRVPSASAAESDHRLGRSCQHENEARSDEQCRCEPVDTQCL